MRRVAVLACVFVALTAPASAGPREDIAKVEKANKACMDKAGTTLEYADCAGTAHGDADAILNKVYQGIVAGLPGNTGYETTDSDNTETLRRLKAAQRAWIAWRDAECDLRGAQMLGGTGENVEIEDCLFTLTAERVKALEDQFDSGR